MSLVEKFKDVMISKFNMSMIGELNFFLGLQVVQKVEGIQIHQQKYLREIIKKIGMENRKPLYTLAATGTKLDVDLHSKKSNETFYRGMVGSLMYLTASRSDIVFAVSLYARFQSDPRELHVAISKRIFRYLKGTDNLCLWYPKNCYFTLVGYTDTYYAGYLVDRKSTSAMAQFLGPCLVSWGSRKQNSVVASTTQAEYITVACCCAQLLWLKQQFKDFGFLMGSIKIRCDNTSAINSSKNHVHHF
ncbi:uncharacterized protein [Phyllobates terribilis]|uniref:uncharacterized protein n=1 Tax=Phyllobates terribilis TaxID=111132 RepID=UPI003CCB5981